MHRALHLGLHGGSEQRIFSAVGLEVEVACEDAMRRVRLALKRGACVVDQRRVGSVRAAFPVQSQELMRLSHAHRR